MLAGLAALGALATNIMLPAFPAMARDLSVGQSALAWTFSAFFVTFALGQLIVGPVTDATGHTRPVFIGLALFAVGSAIGAIADTLRSLRPNIPRSPVAKCRLPFSTCRAASSPSSARARTRLRAAWLSRVTSSLM